MGVSRFAAAALPALQAPPEEVTRPMRDVDVELLREWYYKCTRIPTVPAVIRLKAWSDAHPGDGEALFYVWACYRFNLMYPLCRNSDVKVEDLAEVIKRSAEAGFVPARARWGMILMGTTLVERSGEAGDAKKGMLMIDECIEKRDPDAYSYKGLLLAMGEGGVKRDAREGERYLRLAAEMGAARVWVYLAEVQWREKEVEAAEESLRKGATAGDGSAQFHLAERLLKSAQSQQDLAEAFKWAK